MDRIDRLLLAEEELTPTPDFQARVMEAVRDQAPDQVEMPPLPFPWLSLVLGFGVVPLLTLAALWWLLPLVPAQLQLVAFELLNSVDLVDPRWLWTLGIAGGSALVVVWSYQLAAEL